MIEETQNYNLVSRNRQNETPIHIAMRSGNKQLIGELLSDKKVRISYNKFEKNLNSCQNIRDTLYHFVNPLKNDGLLWPLLKMKPYLFTYSKEYSILKTTGVTFVLATACYIAGYLPKSYAVCAIGLSTVVSAYMEKNDQEKFSIIFKDRYNHVESMMLNNYNYGFNY